MIKRAILAAVIFTLALSSPVWAQDGGTITGKVTNGTEGGSSVADVVVTLHTYISDTEKSTEEKTIDSDGNFQFSGLITASEYNYQVTLDYQGAEYFSDVVTFAEGELSRTADITIYDATTSDEDIVVEEAHIFIYPSQGTLYVIEYFWISNTGDRTYVGSEPINGKFMTLRFALPDSVTGLQYIEGLMECCAISTQGELVDTMAVKPGPPKWVAFAYTVECNSAAYTFSKVVHYPMSVLNLFVEATGVEAASDQLASQPRVDWEGTQFIHLQGQDFDRDATIVIHLSNLPAGDAQGVLKWSTISLAVVIASFGFFYPIMRKKPQPMATQEAARGKRAEAQRRRLLLELAELDDRFEAGQIPQTQYQTLRSQKKARLIDLMHH